MSNKQQENKIQDFQNAIIALQNKCVVDSRYINSDQDMEFQTKLVKEVTLSQDDNIISQLVYNIVQILKDKLEPSESESDIWTYANNYLIGRYSLEFIKQKCSTIPQDKQKLKLWILLEISQKTLDNTFEHIAATDYIKQYKMESSVKDKFLRIVELCKVLQKERYKISGRLPQYFEKYVSEQEIKDASFLPIGKTNTSKTQNGQTNGNMQNAYQESTTTASVINYNVMPSIVDITPKLNAQTNLDTPVNMNSSIKLKESQSTSIKIDINGISPITKVIEESEEERTGKNNKLDLNTLLNMHNTYNGRSSNAVLNTQGLNRGTMGYSDSTANLLAKHLTPHPEEGKLAKRKLPSEHLFKTRYATILDRFSDKYLQASTLANQNYSCQECRAKISKGLYIIGNNAYFCHYTGFWYCYNCIAVDKKPIPWKAVESFDLTSYKVCKKAEKEINSLYAKPIIQFEYDSDVVQKNQVLQDFMILKRQIYLLYNFLCHPEYLEEQLKSSLNLLIKPNIFSLKNFYDINNGSLTKQVEDTYKVFLTHIEGCDKCLKKGIDCILCNQGPKLYLFDIKNTILCDKCNTLYHRNCLLEKDCETCKHDN